MGILSNFFGGGGKSRPNFSNSGVIDPTTGRQVHLSANEINAVMGATGGVAATPFQAAVDGAFKGVELGQEIASNQQTIKAQTIRNDIAEQTKEAEILARNNQIQQQAIQARINTTALTNDNKVIESIQSGDPTKLIEAVSNPALLMSALKFAPEISAMSSQYRNANAFNPVQLQALEKFELTQSIAKNGDAQSAYNSAGKAVAGLPEVQDLQRKSGLPMSQLLAQMTTRRSPHGVDPVTGQPAMVEESTMLVAPNGQKVVLPTKDNDASNKLLAPFFSARQAVVDPAPLKSPTAYPALPVNQQVDTPTTQAPTAALPSGSIQQSTVTPTPDVAPQEQKVNQNGLAPNGVPLKFSSPKLAGLSNVVTIGGEPIDAAAIRHANKLFAQGASPDKAIEKGTEIALREAELGQKTSAKIKDNDQLARDYREMATRIRGAIKQSVAAELKLGPTYWDMGVRTAQIAAGGAFNAKRNENIGGTLNKFQTLSGDYGFLVMRRDGLAAQVINSNAERELLQSGGPMVTKTVEDNALTADKLDALAAQIEEKSVLVAYASSMGRSDSEGLALANKYQEENPALKLTEDGFSLELNPLREAPIKWADKQFGIDSDRKTLDAFSTPTTLPTPPSQPPAAGSGAVTPFAPASKSNMSTFPAPTEKSNMRGVGYDSTPINMKDIKAIAETATVGGNIRQFQSGGSVPLKLDKATPDLIARMIGAESSGDKDAVSQTGVRGLMMVTKPTFKEVSKEPSNIQNTDNPPLTDRTDPTQSVIAGTHYINKMLKRYDGNVDLALAAYNAGSGTVDGILDAQNIPTNRATIDMIAPYLPTTQPTARWVKQITSRGRVSAPQEKQKGNGFFDNFNLQELNPFAASTAQAEELPTSAEAPQNPLPGSNPAVEGPIDLTPPKFTAEGKQIISINNPKVPTTDAIVKAAPLDTAPRNDVPPVSDIDAALKEDQSINASMFPALGAAKKFIRDSAVGRVLGEIKETQGFAALENIVNAATSGLYDEGMREFNESMGFNGSLVASEIRSSLTKLRHDLPKTALLGDVVGSIAFGWGAGAVFKALKGVQVATTALESIPAVTMGQTARAGAAQAGARAFGEGENPGQRIVGGAVGGLVGGAGGALLSGVSKIPSVGGPMALGAGVGALEGAVRGGDPATMAQDASIGAASVTGAAKAGQYAPVVQKALTRAVVMLNNYKGLQAVLALIQKTLTGKTPAETVANLTDEDAYVAKLIQHIDPKERLAWLYELTKAGRNNPQVPVGFADVASQVEPKTLVKIIGQIGEYPAVAAKVMSFLRKRAAGQNQRVADQIGPPELIEQSALRLISLIEGKIKGARKAAITATESIFAKAKETTPTFNSPKITEMLKTDTMRKALRAARADVEEPMVKNTNTSSKLITDTSEAMFKRVRAGEPITDLVKSKAEQKLADNSFEILTEARRKLYEMKNDPAISQTLRRDRSIMYDELTDELNRLSPGEQGFEGANALYAAKLAKTDALTKSTQVDAIRALAGGNIQLALGKLMKLAPSDLRDVMSALDDPKALQDVAKGFLLQKLDAAKGTKDIASNMVSKGEKETLEVLLGPDEAARLFETIQLESKVAKSSQAMTGGSDTFPKAMAQTTLDEQAGKSTTIAESLSGVLSGSPKFTLVRLINRGLSKILPKGDPAKIEKLANTLILSAPDGIRSMEKALRAQGLTKAEIAELGPSLVQWRTLAQGAETGTITSLTSKIDQEQAQGMVSDKAKADKLQPERSRKGVYRK